MKICLKAISILMGCIAPSVVFGYMLLPIDSVYDGDTIMTHISEQRLPPPLNKLSVRISGIDTPEKGGRAKCEKEANLATEARTLLIDLIGDSKTMKLDKFKWDKYGGRIDSTVIINGVDVGEYLISKGVAVPYFGDAKTKNWCE